MRNSYQNPTEWNSQENGNKWRSSSMIHQDALKEGKEPVCLEPQTLCYALSFTLMQLSESVSFIYNLAVS